uniref:Hydrolase_4 domain-containing protein n=1 Tax=Steinernema glaseri TaxID=37863 RepID=A0A1I7YPS7_9BILA
MIRSTFTVASSVPRRLLSFSSTTMASGPYSFNVNLQLNLKPLGSNDFLRTERISFENDGNRYEVDVVLQDTLPEGSPKGTVIATGGSPGSHRDFRYISNHLQKMGIRYVGINFSGYGDTTWNPKLQQTWQERLAYVQAVVDKLQLKENLVFMGHSMGTEPALKAAVQNKDKTAGIVLVNPIGFHPHRALRPFFKIQAMYYFWRLRSIFGGVIDKIVARSEFDTSVVQADFPQQKPFVEKFNETKMRGLLACAGKDPYIGMDTSTEFVSAFKSRADLTDKASKYKVSAVIVSRLQNLPSETPVVILRRLESRLG